MRDDRKNFFYEISIQGHVTKFLIQCRTVVWRVPPLPLQTVLYEVVHVTYSHVHLYIASCLHRQKVNQEDWVLR